MFVGGSFCSRSPAALRGRANRHSNSSWPLTRGVHDVLSRRVMADVCSRQHILGIMSMSLAPVLATQTVSIQYSYGSLAEGAEGNWGDK
jgi:hypothetical protein